MADQVVLGVMLNGAEQAIANLAQIDGYVKGLNGKNIKITVSSSGITRAANQAEKLSTNLNTAASSAQKIGASGPQAMQKTAKATESAAGSAQKFSLGLGSIAANLLKFQAVNMVISGTSKAFKDAFTEMKAVDTEMVTIRKVTGFTADEMDRLSKNAYSLASKYGRTASEVMSGESVFARAGYTDQIEQLAELSLLLQNVGDLQSDDAAKFLIATDAAYKFGGSQEKLMAVIDGLNEITNKHATDMQKMTDGMTIAGSVFAESGESIEVFAALLGAATANTQRSGSEMARGLRTILMNLRQIRGETEDGELIDGESIATAAKALKEYAGISTMENGKLRKASDVLEELAGKWETLSDTQKAAVAEAVAWKRQANVLMALMGSWDTYQQMLADFAGGTGSALKENEIYMDSWVAKTQQIKASWTELVSSIVDSDLIKQFLSGVVNVLDDINYRLDDSEGKINRLQGDANTASANASEAREQYKTDFGPGSRYDELLKRYDTLTENEKVELGILASQKQERERLVKLAEAEAKAAAEKVEAEKEKQVQDRNNKAKEASDAFENRLEGINMNFMNTKDVNAYADALGRVVGEYSNYYTSLLQAQAAGTELTDQEAAFVEAYSLVARTVAEGGDAFEVYGKIAAAASRASGDQATVALEVGNRAVEQIAAIGEAIDNIPSSKDIAINITGNIDTGGLSNIASAIGGLSLPGFASGTEGAPGGPALVNENGPELISANGLAWVAGGGKPTVTMLPRGATVLTAQQTRQATRGRKVNGIPAFAGGVVGLIESLFGGKGEKPDAVAGQWISEEQRAASAASTGPLTIDIFNAPVTQKQEYPHGRTVLVTDDPVDAEDIKGRGPTQYTRRRKIYDPETGKNIYGNGGYWNGDAGPTPPDFKALEEDLSKLLKNLDMQAELAENQEDFVKAMEVYGEAQEAIAELLEQYRANGYAEDSDEILRLANLGYDYAHKQLGGYDDLQSRLIDALNALTDATDDANAIAERQEAVDKAREALQNAERQRTVRIFNPVTGQWEWIANAGDVQKAREALQSAEQALEKEQIDQTLSAIKNAKPEDLAGMTLTPAVLDKLFNGTPEQQTAFLNALNAATGGADYLGSAAAQTEFNQGNSIGTQYNLNGITLTEQQAAGMSIKDLLDMLRGLKMMG